MQVKTKAIVLSSLKFQEKSLIVKCFTLSHGLKSYFVRDAFSSRKSNQKIAYFQPMTILEIEAVHKNKGTLENFKEIKIAAVSAYLSGMPQSQIRRKYHIKGSATLYNWVHLIQTLGLEGVKNQQRHKTNYSYTFIIKVISWRLEKQASLPMTAKRFHIRHPAQIWQWEQALKAGRLKPDKQRRTGNMTK